MTSRAYDKQFARISAWLVANGYTLRSLNTARSNKKAVVLVLEKKNDHPRNHPLMPGPN